jgi:aspartyl-tRNA(Asn)/glutamyl-tRNA(Gln) amidotransferase subunit A
MMTLATAVKLIARKEISPVELTRTLLDEIDKVNDRMRIFITVMRDEALEAARVLEQEIAGGSRSACATARSLNNRLPLHGIPVSVKDLYDTAGIRTTAGAKIFEDRVPEEDAVAVRMLKNAGAVIIGKTNLHEFAYGVTTINPHYGTARNPWDPDRIPGGSSGGSASAVALGLGLGSLGTDTGGSIRIPASLCGIVGLKPTYGRVSLRGVVPLSWSLDHAGPMARTVEDAAILLQTIDGRAAKNPLGSLAADVSDANDIKGIRIGIPRTYFYDQIAPEVGDAVRGALRNLERLGARLLEVDLPSTATTRGVWLQIASPEVYSYHEPYLKDRAHLYGADIRARIEAGRVLLSIDYVRAQRIRTLLKRECKNVFQIADVIVTPTTPIAAPRIDEVDRPWSGGPEKAAAALTRFTRFFNLVGLPAISIPCGFTSGGLPIGMQIVGKAFDESTVLRVAHAYEQDAKWFERQPRVGPAM